jgi:hypothetical protein
MSVKEPDIVSIAKDFAEEAYWDLQVAKKLLKKLKLSICKNSDEVFYIGRRILYLLQQASEKAAKAYLFAYIKSWIGILVTTVDKGISKGDKNKYTEIISIHEELKSIYNKLEPKNIGHKPHEAFLDAVCDIYVVFYKNKNSIIEYMRYFFDKSLQNLTDKLFNFIKKYVKKSNESSLQIPESTKMVINNIINIYNNVIVNPIISYLEKLDLETHTRKSIEYICKEREIGEQSPPCINEEMLESLKLTKETYDRMLLTIEKQVYEYFKKSNIETQIMEMVKIFGNVNEDYVSKIIESQLELYQKYIINAFSSVYFSYYLFTYLAKVYPCLLKYETAGRYPEDITVSRDKICQDIEKLKFIKEEIEFLVNTIKDSIEQYIKAPYLALLNNEN